MSVSYPYAVNVDWLQVFCHDRNAGFLNVIYSERADYEFKLLPHQSRHFKEIWEVVNQDGDKYATIQRMPHSSIISSDGCIIQLANRELYKAFYMSTFILFLNTHNFIYKSISRLDVCFDSNHLYNGLSHSNLIKRIMSGTYLKSNQSRVKWNFTSIANVGKPMECNSCSFGSLSSSVSSKMYNKSLEMREQKNKPYIEENWLHNGLDTTLDVWRIEISIKSDAATSIVADTGEVFKLTPDSVKNQKTVEDVFFSYAKKYFAFKKNDGTKNKTRMPDVQLFPKDRKPTLHPVRITQERDATRGDRIFLKKLHSLITDLPNMDKTTWNAIWEVSNTFSLSRSLCEWRAGRLIAETESEFEVRKYEDSMMYRMGRLFRNLADLYPQKAHIIYKLETELYLTLLPDYL